MRLFKYLNHHLNSSQAIHHINHKNSVISYEKKLNPENILFLHPKKSFTEAETH
jgi:ABC-type hemin transport system substrate-binding protein